MGQRADRDLHTLLTTVIDELNTTADAGIPLTPTITRIVARTLTTVRDTHTALAEYEAIIDGVDNVVAIRSVQARTG
jgi:hypothetical protein